SVLSPQRGAGSTVPGVWGCPPTLPFPPTRGCRGLPAGGLGCPPTLPSSPTKGVQGSPCRGFGGVPQLFPPLFSLPQVVHHLLIVAWRFPLLNRSRERRNMDTRTKFTASPYAGEADLQPICDLMNLCNEVDKLEDEP